MLTGTGIANADPAPTYGSLNDRDPEAYAMTLAHDGDYETPESARNLAMQVCSSRASGWGEAALRHDMERRGYSIDLSIDVVDDGEFHFCPWYSVNSDTGGPLFPQYQTPPPPMHTLAPNLPMDT